jgi:hypothetical protein
MSELEDRVFTMERTEAAEGFYEDLCEFVRDQQQRLRADDRAAALLQLDPNQPYSPEMLTLMLLAALRSPARGEFLRIFPPQRLPAALVQRIISAWLDGEIFLAEEARDPLLDAVAHSLPREALVQRLVAVTGTTIGAERAFTAAVRFGRVGDLLEAVTDRAVARSRPGLETEIARRERERLAAQLRDECTRLGLDAGSLTSLNELVDAMLRSQRLLRERVRELEARQQEAEQLASVARHTEAAAGRRSTDELDRFKRALAQRLEPDITSAEALERRRDRMDPFGQAALDLLQHVCRKVQEALGVKS